jgi:hypothetical protein
MANRKDSVEALLKRSEKDIGKIEEEYRTSLKATRVSSDLKIEIKHFCEDLRSVLDYLANDIREASCPNAKPKEKFYFPILPDRKKFEDKTNEWFPDLGKNNPDLWSYVESVQPYHTGYKWIDMFNKINNDNKHSNLVEQTQTEIEEIRVTSQNGTRVSWNRKGVTFGPGVYIAGVPVNPNTQLPVPNPSQKVEKIVWVDFQFAGMGISALQLLRQTLEGIKKITEEVYRLTK